MSQLRSSFVPSPHKQAELVEICRTLGASEDIDSLLEKIVTAACDLTDSAVCAILLYEEETDLLKFVAGPASRKNTSRRLRVPLDRTAAGWVYQQSKSVIIQNAASDTRIQQNLESPLGIEIRNFAGVPLLFRGQTIGVLEAFNKESLADYTEEDLIILETLGAQAAMTLLSSLLMDEAERAYTQVEELEKLKSDFISIASHELRTPLGLILGHATFLTDAIRDEQQRHQLDVIIRSAMRLKSIIEDLSHVDNYQRGKTYIRHKTFSLDSMVSRLVDAYKDTARRKKIALKTRLPEHALTLEGEEEKISLAISNILSNALTFTNESGHVAIMVDTLPGYVKISVIDDGIGIPSKDLPRVFDRFYQVQSHLTRRHGGMGLGLSVAKAMVEAHGGQIWAESVEGKGSNFSVLLPMKGSETPTTPIGKVPAFV